MSITEKKNRQFDWTTITKKRGDDGASDVLFGVRLRKSHPVFELQAELEVMQVKLAQMRFSLKGMDDSALVNVGGPYSEELTSVEGNFYDLKNRVNFDKACRAIMGAVIAFPNLDKYEEKFPDTLLTEETLEQVDSNIQQVGLSMNRLSIQPGWTNYGDLGPMGLSFGEATTQVRRTEVAFYKFLDGIHSDLSCTITPSYSLERQFLNRTSKATHMYMAVLAKIESAN